MIKKNGYPVCAKETHVQIAWSSANSDNLEFVNGLLAFDNINVIAGAGEIQLQRTSLGFNPEDPIQWRDSVPDEIKQAFPDPESCLRYVLGEIYESEEHKSILESDEE